MLINELRSQRAELVNSMDALLDVADKEDRDFTEQEEKDFADMEVKYDELDAKIAKEEKRMKRSERVKAAKKDLDKISKPATRTTIEIGGGAEGEFRNFGEFMYSVAKNPNDPRLNTEEHRVQQMKDGTSGGFGVPKQFLNDLLSVSPQDSIVRPRANVIPAGSPPDAEITVPALDQGANSNMYGGITIYHSGEGDERTESDAKLLEVSLTPKEIHGYTTISNKLLTNWAAAGSFLQNQMRLAMLGAEDTDFLTGNGVNKALGIINAPAGINYNRAAANQISFDDVINMQARLRSDAGAVWVASRTILPQLANIRDVGNNNLWVQSAAAGVPGTLSGIPLVYNERSPSLGSKGDLMLLNFGMYLIKDGSGPFVATSEHIRFKHNETAFRITNYVDGQPWLKEPIPLEGDTAQTVSPFIILDIPA
ncbi:MAG: phage major capsid protein [Candidatus Omnitrophica bacterium]|nr:phage major capsid protein [Candidatus Omnitrophota bacterium]